MVRQYKTPKFRLQPLHALEPNALVVGNPDLEGWEDFSDLPGARSEAEKVMALLNANGFRAIISIDEKTDAILSRLHQKAYRILHLAGHGVHEFEIIDPSLPKDPTGCEGTPKRMSGMVVGKGTILTPGDVEQMRWVPELVFINCCHLGKTGSSRHVAFGPLAANLSIQFIDMGVKAVVAAGWAVDDGAAATFAETFYQRMTAGDTFGEAVRAAREEIWLRYPNVNTWGAYQCYGDPAFRLHGEGPKAPQKGKRPYVTPHELIADLDNHRQWIRMQMQDQNQDQTSLGDLREPIGKFLDRIPQPHREKWLSRADVTAAVGFAWGETGSYRTAVDWLDKAITAKDGQCPIRAVEQAANFKVRAAAADWLVLRGEKAEAEQMEKRPVLLEEVQQALDSLERLVKVGANVERLNMLGSAYKRQACIAETGKDRQKAIENMKISYQAAYEMECKKAPTPDPYPFSNYALATLLLELLDKSGRRSWKKKLTDDCRKMINTARKRYAQRPNFWDATAEADCLLILLLANPGATAKKIEEDANVVLAKYKEAGRRGTSPRKMASIREHIDFILEVHKASNTKIEDALRIIRNGI
jgi:tetratricopeptide (TPR) repeat protein